MTFALSDFKLLSSSLNISDERFGFNIFKTIYSTNSLGKCILSYKRHSLPAESWIRVLKQRVSFTRKLYNLIAQTNPCHRGEETLKRDKDKH